MALYDEFKDRRKDFEILAFHDTRASSLEDLDGKITKVKAEVWGGRDLPFPILLDTTGETIRTFDVDAFPTVIAIDPKGNIVRGGGEHSLREYLLETDPAVQKMLKKLAAAKGPAFAKAAEEVANEGPRAGFALFRTAKGAKPEQVAAIRAALAKVQGPYAVSFFFGEHGLVSEDRSARLEAAKVLGEIAESGSLYGLVQCLNAEKDDEVKKAMVAAVEAIQARGH